MSRVSRQLVADYGHDVTTVRGARRHLRSVAPSPPLSRGRYLAQVRAILRRRDVLVVDGHQAALGAWASDCDGRLLSVAFNHEPPNAWARGCECTPRRRGCPHQCGPPRVVAWLRYWYEAAERPDVVGSSYNPDPDGAYRAWRAGVPAWVVRRLGFYATPKTCRRLPRRRIRTLRHAARAAARTSLSPWFDCGALHPAWSTAWSTKTLAALGRLCPELQRIAIDETVRRMVASGAWHPRDEYRPAFPAQFVRGRDGTERIKRIRVRDIAWDAVARAQKMLSRDQSGRVRAALARGRRRTELVRAALGDCSDQRCPCISLPLRRLERRKWICPAYPTLREDLAARIVLGESPRDLAPGLTKREAHLWCLDGGTIPPHEWLSRRLGDEAGSGVPWFGRDVATVRWLDAVARDSRRRRALERLRTIRDPLGREHVVCYADRVDEVREEDLVEGTRTSVSSAIERAAARIGRRIEEEWSGDHRTLAPTPAWWTPMRCARVLRTPAQLVEQGRREGHCVGGYVEAVANRSSVIVALDVLGERSTVELTAAGEVRQHYAARNASPGPLCQRALNTLLRRIAAKGRP